MKKRRKKAIITTQLIERICAINKVIGLRMTLYAKSKHISLLVGCSNTSVQRIIKAHIATNYSTDWKIVLNEYRDLNDEEQLIRMYKNEGEVMSTNIITIEKGIPIPNPTTARGGAQKYDFLKGLEIGDSFVVNGHMPDFTPKAVRCQVYDKCKELGMTVTIRTLEGKSDSPQKIRVWRTA